MATPTLGDQIFYKFTGTEILGVNFHTHYGPGAGSVIPDSTVHLDIPTAGTVASGFLTEIVGGGLFHVVVWTTNRAYFVRNIALGVGLGQFVLKV